MLYADDFWLARHLRCDYLVIHPHQHQPLWFAFIAHRLSGLILSLFLPIHFYVLTKALTDPQAFDNFLHWSELPMVKFAEFGLVFLLAVHLFGGLRLLTIEFLPWHNRQKNIAASVGALAFLISLGYLLNSF